MKNIFCVKWIAVLLLAGAGFSLAQPQPQPAPEAEKAPSLTPEEKAIGEQANAYIAAYNKGDAKTIAGFFAEDAEWVDDDGHVLNGRADIESSLKTALAASKGRKLDIAVESVRLLSADVLVEKGTTTVIDPDGKNAVNSYTAVHVKKGSDWLISELTETGAPLAGSGALKLRELGWLVGSWVDKSEDMAVKVKVDWTANHTFLTRSFTAQRGDAEEHSGTEVIGFDPVSGKVHSWVFESDGSFADNVWTQDGKRWLIQAKVTLPDGRQATAQHTLTRVDQDRATWSSANRQLDGELLPNIDAIEIIRVK